MIGYLDEVIRPVYLILPKMSEYVELFKDNDGDKEKNKNNKLMSFSIANDKLLEKCNTIWIKIEDLQILNWMLYQFRMVDNKFTLIF